MAYPINSPYAQFTDGNGDPLENGYIWIGTANLDAAANPITVYWDDAAAIPAAQPIRTLNGFPVWNGSPANIYATPVEYSIKVLNKNGSLVFSSANVNGEIVTSDSVTFLQAGSGAVATTVQAKLRESAVSIIDFGADPTGVSDSTIAIRNAVNTGKPVYIPSGTYLMTEGIRCVTPGQVITGDGPDQSIIKVTSAFTGTPLGMFWCSNLSIGPQLSNFKIQCTQPDTSSRGSLFTYPNAIYVADTPYTVIRNLKITNANFGAELTGETKGTVISQFYLSAYDVGLSINGSTKTITIDEMFFQPFDMTTNQQAIFNDNSSIAVQSGQCETLKVSNSCFSNKGRHLRLYASGSYKTNLFAVNTAFENYASVWVQDGNAEFTNCTFSIIDADVTGLIVWKGNVVATNCKFYNNIALTYRFIQSQNVFGNVACVSISDSLFDITGDTTVITSAKTLLLDNNVFYLTANTVLSKPVIDVPDGGVTITGNVFSDLGTGTGTAITLSLDSGHVVSLNKLNSWNINLPATVYFTRVNNNFMTPDFNNGYLQASLVTKRYSGVLDGSGNMTVAHGLTNGATRTVQAYAYYKAVSGAMKQLTFDYVDATNFAATGGVAGQPFKAIIVYELNPFAW